MQLQILTKRPERMREYLSQDSLYGRVLRAADEFRNKRPQLCSIGISNPKDFPAKWIHHWIRSIVQQCKAAGVACFVKQLGAKPMEGILKTGSKNEWDNIPVLQKELLVKTLYDRSVRLQKMYVLLKVANAEFCVSNLGGRVLSLGNYILDYRNL